MTRLRYESQDSEAAEPVGPLWVELVEMVSSLTPSLSISSISLSAVPVPAPDVSRERLPFESSTSSYRPAVPVVALASSPAEP